MLTDTTTDTKVRNHKGFVQDHDISVHIFRFKVFRLNGLWRGGTDLFANHTRDFHGVRQATSCVKERGSQLNRAPLFITSFAQFFFHRNFPNSTGGHKLLRTTYT